MKPCAKNQKLLSLLATGVLASGQAEELRAHIKMCPGCQRYFEEMSNVAGKLTASSAVASEIEASPTFHRNLARRIETEGRPGVGAAAWEFLRSGGLRWRWVMPVAGVALGVFVVLTHLEQLRGKRTISPTVVSVVSTAKPTMDLAPTFGTYRMLADRSLDELNQELTKEAEVSSPGMPTYTALSLGRAITAD
jgi:anti-sigma factor RsiW